MVKMFWISVLLTTGASLLSAVPLRVPDEHNKWNVTSILYVNNPYLDGEWGVLQMCPERSHVHAFELLYQAAGIKRDETALNGIKLYCSNDIDHMDQGYIMSTNGPDGEWMGMRVCPVGTFMTGFRAKVLEKQGLVGDDVAVEDFRAQCNYGPVLTGAESDFGGTWSFMPRCSLGSAVCGIQTRVKAHQIADDDVALTDFQLLCCTVQGTKPTTPMPPTEQPSTTNIPTSILPTEEPSTTLIPTSILPTEKPSTPTIPTSIIPTEKPSTTFLPTSILPTEKPSTPSIPTTILPTENPSTTSIPTSILPTEKPSTPSIPTTILPTEKPSTTFFPTSTIPTENSTTNFLPTSI